MNKKIFLSDNDGTLTVARKKIVGEMAETLIEFTKHFRFAVVTGSPYKDMMEQMPEEVLQSENVDFWCCMGNALYRQGKEVYNSHNTIDFNMFKDVLDDIDARLYIGLCMGLQDEVVEENCDKSSEETA